MGKTKDNAAVLNVLTGEMAEPDYSEKLAFFKAALVGYATSIKRGEPKDELRRIFIEKLAELDEMFVHGGGDEVSRLMDARIVKVLASYDALLLGYLTVQNMSDEEARTMARDMATSKAQTAPREQVKNAKHAFRLVMAERDKGKKNPGGQRKPGGLRAQKVVMRAIQRKKDAYARTGKRVPGVLKLISELRKAGKDIPWEDGYVRNMFSMWDSKRDDFRKQTAHGS